MFKSIFIMIFLFSFSYSNEDILNQNQTFFLPQQGNEAKDKIVELILTSKESKYLLKINVIISSKAS